MKKTTLNSAIAVAMGVSALAATSVEAAVLSIDQGVKTTTSFTYNGITYTNTTTTGSWFSMDADVNGKVAPGEITPIGGNNGITVDGVTTQAASGSHGGAPGCVDGVDPGCNLGGGASENPDIDNPWLFFSNTGMHQTTSAVSTLSNDSAGNVELDFSGWNVTWAGIPGIPMSGDPANFGLAGNDGIAVMTCAVDCGNGDTYVLNYAATVPQNDASGFGGVPYVLHLEGSITGDLPPVAAIPVPAAVWLFGSGLLGLVGVSRRRKA